MKNKNTLFIFGAVFIGICLLCVAAAFGIQASENTNAKTADQYMQEYGGNADVYAKILALTDCGVLQEEFNIAESNLSLQEPGTPQYKWGLGYMAASDARMRDVGCYK